MPESEQVFAVGWLVVVLMMMTHRCDAGNMRMLVVMCVCVRVLSPRIRRRHVAAETCVYNFDWKCCVNGVFFMIYNMLYLRIKLFS